MVDEIAQRGARLRAGHRIVECVERSRTIGKALRDHRDHRFGDGVGAERARRFNLAGPAGAEAFAVVCVEVPVTANRRVGVHENIVAPAHPAIEALEQQVLATVGELIKVGERANKVAVGADFQIAIERSRSLGDRGLHPMVAGLHDDQPVGPRLVRPAGDFLSEAAAVVVVVERGVMHPVAVALQGLAKVAHGREKQRKPYLVLGNIRRLFAHLEHENGVSGLVKIFEGR